MEIYISENDIFDFVVGNTLIDPIERCIGSRYEVIGEFIYDYDDRKFFYQNDLFQNFSRNVLELKNKSFRLTRSEIQENCKELVKNSPKFINL